MASDFRLKEQLPTLTQRIVETYQEGGPISHLGHCPLQLRRHHWLLRRPERDSVPWFSPPGKLAHGQCLVPCGRPGGFVARQAPVQIGRALRHDAGANTICSAERGFEALGQAKAIQFLEQIPELRGRLRMDVVAAYEGDPAVKNTDEVTFCYPGLEAVTIYRLAHQLHRLEIPFIRA